MIFKKYTSIENTYRQKYIDKFNEVLPEWQEEISFVAHEKLDGANIQLVFIPDEKMLVGKRTSYLEENDSFFDIWNTLAKYQSDLDHIQECVNETRVGLRIFGELYGPGINGRINYGSEKKIAFFDIYTIGGEYKMSNDNPTGYGWSLLENKEEERLLSQQEFEALLFNGGLLGFICPLVGHFNTLDKALAVDVETLQMAGSNGSEGIVIQPYNKVVRMPNGERFILKKKSKKFEDNRVDQINAGQKAEPKEKDIIYDLNKVFKGYITKNRVLDTFAKHGPIQEPKQIGTYIALVLEDAKADFLKDHDLTTLVPNMEKKREKDLFNVGSAIVSILKEYL